jgi:hypothetical protein
MGNGRFGVWGNNQYVTGFYMTESPFAVLQKTIML